MNKLLTLSSSDFRSTFRDPIFRGLLVFPFVAFALIRWGWPIAVAKYPFLAPYATLVLMWGCLQSATMFGFIYGFLFLEEKEDNIWQAIRVLPVSGLQLVFSRLLLGLVVSTLVNFCLIHYGKLIQVSLAKELLLSFEFSLAAPLIALSLGAFAKNRIEGLAQMKIVNLLLIIPGLIYILPHKAVHVLAVLPTYWSFRAMEYAGDNSSFWLFYLVGMVIHLVVILLLNQRLVRSINS